MTEPSGTGSERLLPGLKAAHRIAHDVAAEAKPGEMLTAWYAGINAVVFALERAIHAEHGRDVALAARPAQEARLVRTTPNEQFGRAIEEARTRCPYCDEAGAEPEERCDRQEQEARTERPQPSEEIARLRKMLDDEERAHAQTIDERDAAQEAADNLAYAIAPMEEIGEHSNLNDPWANALEILRAQGEAERPAAEEDR